MAILLPEVKICNESCSLFGFCLWLGLILGPRQVRHLGRREFCVWEELTGRINE
jgi:hypothetical protein